MRMPNEQLEKLKQQKYVAEKGEVAMSEELEKLRHKSMLRSAS